MKETVIVAHRGLSAHYPENTLLALQKAIDAGARAVEFDVQLTADGTPVLFHDPDLLRLTGRAGAILETRWRELKDYRAAYPERFADRFSETPVNTLQEAVEFLTDWPEVLPCIEIKPQSIEHFGIKKCVDAVLAVSEALIERSLPLSFDRSAIEYLHSQGLRSTGWVLENYDDAAGAEAERLMPRVLICGIDKLPGNDELLWQGAWQWMLYHSEDKEVILDCIRRGAHYVETNNIEAVFALLPELFDDGH